MRTTTRVGALAGSLALATVLGAPAALAQTTADYTGTGDTAVRGEVLSRGESTGTGTGTRATSGSTSPSMLPFTGGEVVLLATTGALALAAGTVMVVGGRRRATPA